MLAGKKMTDFTNLFSPYDFEKNDRTILSYFRDDEIDKTNLTDQTKIRLNEITEIDEEINQRKSCRKKLSKYATAYHYIDKILIVLSATSGGVCIISSVSLAEGPVGIAGSSFTLILSLTTKN